MKFAVLKIPMNQGYNIAYTGKDLKIYYNKKSFLLESFCYLKFEELLSKFGGNIKPQLRQKMKSNYKGNAKKFWQEDDKYWKNQNKIILPITLGILILLSLLK